ncbi:MAG: hypothetical protein AAFQ74_08645 [Cyanobacteria bacterium J06623_4]
MQSFRESSNSPTANLSFRSPLDPTLTVALSTFPLLTLLVSSQLIAKGMTQLGQSSEELFRGERLPILPLLNPQK